ncbi:methylglyoxal reductase (NADPH-dependent) gre2 [Sporothrix eucalyptigena]|uniref:Methylglyoxal reductase (NADPH-dependent) gre2 n=1 Tax=Sporothrix eucalyptigena TaxID=1812306 RepID=A0ABP0D271_9PEZI
MTRALLTGGTGFIAAHILDQLLQKGHSVVTTARTPEKATSIHAAHPDVGPDRLQTVVVPDAAIPGAFDMAVQAASDIEVVLHTASPFHFHAVDIQRDLIDPAVGGTCGLLRSIVAHAPQVRRFVLTSSAGAMMDIDKLDKPATTFDETSWNPMTLADVTNGTSDAIRGYLLSKTLSERLSWDFVAEKQPNFDLVSINPPMVFGPILHPLAAINTSNERIHNAISGVWKRNNCVPDPGVSVDWVDVRDVAAVHVLAGLERPAAGGMRLLAAAPGQYDNRAILDIIRDNFPKYGDRLPDRSVLGGDKGNKRYRIENHATNALLDMKWRSLEECVVDTVHSLEKYVD